MLFPKTNTTKALFDEKQICSISDAMLHLHTADALQTKQTLHYFVWFVLIHFRESIYFDSHLYSKVHALNSF